MQVEMSGNSAGTPDERYQEDGLLFDCAGATLVGVLARPKPPREPQALGVLIVVGGPQYRVGSHRQFVALARSLAVRGHAVLRFDYRGMGDSGGEARDFLSVDADIGAAVGALLAAAPSVRGVALWGLCDGASAALLYCNHTRDRRVERLVLLNPWVRSPQNLARMQVRHYYRERLRERAFWAKLLSGRVAWGALSDLARTVGTLMRARRPPAGQETLEKPFPARMAHAWNAFEGGILLLLSENDYTAKEFLELTASEDVWQQALAHPVLTRRDIDGADHTFSEPHHARALERCVADWLADGGSEITMPAGPVTAPSVDG